MGPFGPKRKSRIDYTFALFEYEGWLGVRAEQGQHKHVERIYLCCDCRSVKEAIARNTYATRNAMRKCAGELRAKSGRLPPLIGFDELFDDIETVIRSSAGEDVPARDLPEA